MLFLFCHRVGLDNKTKELQYKILMRYVATNYLLYKMKKVLSQTCSFCMLEPETIEHLFFDCILVKNIWFKVFNEFNYITNCIAVPTLKCCILGDFNIDLFINSTYMSLYILSLMIKSYIMQCKYDHAELSYIGLKRVLKSRVQLLRKSSYYNETFNIILQFCDNDIIDI